MKHVQDKVGDFSGFTPDKLLLETEKALSFDNLYKPHNRLIELQENVSLPVSSLVSSGPLRLVFSHCCKG